MIRNRVFHRRMQAGALFTVAGFLAAGCASEAGDAAYHGDAATPSQESLYASHDDNRRDAGAAYRGVDGARRAHAKFSSDRAEALDGDCERYVKILQGETLSDIAELCDVPVAAIISANPALGDPRAVSAGVTLLIPDGGGDVYEGGRVVPHAANAAPQARRPATANWFGRDGYDRRYYDDYAARAADLGSTGEGLLFYVIRQGDTLSEIAQRYDVSLADIAYLNPRLAPRRLAIGDRVILPDYARRAPWSREVNRIDAAREWSAHPIVSISPARGAPGSEIRVFGDGLPPNSTVRLYFGEGENALGEYSTLRADRFGRLSGAIRVPADYSRPRALIALRHGASGNLAISEVFAVDLAAHASARNETPGFRAPPAFDLAQARLSTAQREIAPNEAVRLIARRFPPNAPVSIYAGPDRASVELVARTMTNADGVFDVSARIPDASRDDASVIFVAAPDDAPQTVVSDPVRIRSSAASLINGAPASTGRGAGEFGNSLEGQAADPHGSNQRFED